MISNTTASFRFHLNIIIAAEMYLVQGNVYIYSLQYNEMKYYINFLFIFILKG